MFKWVHTWQIDIMQGEINNPQPWSDKKINTILHKLCYKCTGYHKLQAMCYHDKSLYNARTGPEIDQS